MTTQSPSNNTVTASPETDNTKTTKSSLDSLKGLVPFMLPYKPQCLFACLALLTAAGSTLSIPIAFRQMIDLGFSSQIIGKSLGAEDINYYFLALFILACVLAAASASRYFMVTWLGERITADIRNTIYRHVLTQSPQFFETARSGDVLSRLNTDTTLIQTVVGTSISLGLRNTLTGMGGLTMMAFTSPKLSLIIIVLLLFIVVPIVAFARKVRKLSRESQDRVADSSALAGEILNAMSTVQAFTHENIEAQRFKNSIEDSFLTAIRRIRARALLTFMAILLIFGSIVFVLWMGAHAVIDGKMTAGALSQFVLYAVLAGGAMGSLSEVMGDVQLAAGATERLLGLLMLSSPIQSPAFPKYPPSHATNGSTLSLNNVNFHYPSRPQTPSLSDFSLVINSGETVAIVGSSGAGKTTLFQLLLRFYDPQKGDILLDGVNIRDLQLNTLRDAIGIVPQETVIFSANALENIRYGKSDACDEAVINAAKLAAAHEFIKELPEGYHTFLGDRGVRLSGGQRQRIAIARALLKNPPLLLLDEATSALDAESERLVQIALETAIHGRTTLIIAHRLATVKRADRIIVIEHGKIIETGTHNSLVALGGTYARLATLQFQATT